MTTKRMMGNREAKPSRRELRAVAGRHEAAGPPVRLAARTRGIRRRSVTDEALGHRTLLHGREDDLYPTALRSRAVLSATRFTPPVTPPGNASTMKMSTAPRTSPRYSVQRKAIS